MKVRDMTPPEAAIWVLEHRLAQLLDDVDEITRALALLRAEVPPTIPAEHAYRVPL